MKTFMTQLKFDGKRLVFRDYSYQFFTTLMPLAFYLLFTKIFTVGNAAEMKIFNKSYLGSMIIYSVLISAIFGFAQIMRGDRDQGFVDFLGLSPKGKLPYYFSLGFWMIMLSLFSILVLTITAIIFNGVKLTIGQFIALLIIPMIGQIPLLLIGLAMSNITRHETLSVVSNLVTFPMAIISGLWWPLTMMPDWVQKIGKLMPTYFANNILSKILIDQKIKLTDFGGIAIWIVLGLILVVFITKLIGKKGVVTSNA
ncbi:ABC transporter permease [Xylocopilactobacillus apis]|uniref:Multidrug ABC transporter permease n=1 Tax=Xylocopilactobacillus apis TaxID=2932183 RepID=A0AAU9D0T7_9LACO|nr:ABC transporter permease [Xylocopilactobacillus apis]BDR57163.1 multidrug ABC transporter permease [Xylocopilactobacillus apis]